MNLEQIKREVNLIEYARKYGIDCNSQGKAICPFHPNEKNPSFEIKKHDEIWRWYDWHLGKGDPDFSGTIIDLVARMENISEKEACQKLLKEFDSGKLIKRKIEIEREHIYKDEKGNPIYKKIKYRKNSLGITWGFKHMIKSGKWENKKGPQELIPYNLDKFKDHTIAIICEGEKDADTITALDIDLLATSAPTGKSNWSESITKYFEHFKKVTFLYDVGNDEEVKKHAAKLKRAFPVMDVNIAKVPLEKKEADITEYLEQEKMKDIALLDILDKEEKFEVETKEEQRKGIFIGTFEDFMNQEIPEEEILVKDIAFRGALTGIGGVKGSHKSFFVNQLAFHFASGSSPFLKFEITKPGRVLLIQQEVSLGFNKTRLKKMQESGHFETNGGFFPITTTAKPLKLIEQKDHDQIRKWVNQYQPNLLILDPLSSFNPAEENTSRDMTKIVNIFSELKSEFDLGLIFTHHFSSKLNPGDPTAPSEAGGWFRGHSSLPDACDVLICLHRLPGQRENLNLPRDYEDYNLVQIQLRNGKWPERFAIEFHGESFLIHESSIWQELGKKIIPGEIEDLLEENGGEMLRTNLINILRKKAGITIIKKAIRETLRNGTIEKETIKAKGNPVLLRLKK